MSHILITGGTGLIGKKLCALLINNNHTVTILTRNKAAGVSNNSLTYATWNVEKKQIDKDAIMQADYIVHLAGAGVADKRWSTARKQEIIDSRIQSCELLVHSLKEYPNHVKAVISSSAIGWYGADTADAQVNGFTESAPADDAFLGHTCRAWEASISPIQDLGKRLVILRTGIVLGRDGGAYAEFVKPIKAGVAAILGHGNQVISWIHIEDICRMFLFAIENAEMNGIYNAVAPNPVSNKVLTINLAKQMRGRFFIPVHVPSFILKWVMGEMSVEVLKSATVSSKKIEDAGFKFSHSNIDTALGALINNSD